MKKRLSSTNETPSHESPSSEPSQHYIARTGPEPNEADLDCKPSAQSVSSGLYIVATPIGNARDITLRALDVLTNADLVLCEDTRVTSKLFARHSISNTLMAYHEHNAKHVRPEIIKRLKNGGTVALVSDAGTPLVSDPGYRLVESCIEEGITLTTIPGASAVLSALVLSGLPTDRFFFHGFLPNKTVGRQKALAEIKDVPGSLVFLESAKRLAASLSDMAEVLGPRPVAVTRELTKIYEEIKRGSLEHLSQFYRENGPPKGEVTIVVGPPQPVKAPVGDELDALISDALSRFSVKEVARQISLETGLAKRLIYNRALELKNGTP